MHVCIHWHCSIDMIDCCAKLSLVDETYAKNGSHFDKEMISAWGNMFLGGELKIDAKNPNLEICENALYMKSGSMPLTKETQSKNYHSALIFS